MSDYRRPTAKLGRVKKDPRADTLPPGPPRGRMSEQLLPRVEPLRKFPDEAKTGRSGRLEELLAKEKAERDTDAAKMGELLARAVRAESEAQAMTARVAELEAQVAALRRGKHDSVPTLANARALAGELAKILDKVAPRDQGAPPSSKGSLTDLAVPRSARGGGG